MISLNIDGYFATLTLNRPEKLNAITFEMLQQLEQHIQTIEDETDVRVVLLKANGEKAFCVGADILAWSELEAIDMWRKWIRYGHTVFNQLEKIRQPLIAVLHGHILGGGLELAMTADIRIASENSTMGQPEVKIATVPGMGGTQRLPQLIGKARAKQMIFSGIPINSQTAYEWGMVNEVIPSDQLDKRANELAQEIASNAPLAVQFAKLAIDGDLQGTGYALESLAGSLSAHTQDAQEGLVSFKEKRSPDYSGK